MVLKKARRLGGRRLTVAERALAAVTATLAVATVALAIASSARASAPAGVLPPDGPQFWQPASIASHAEATPAPDGWQAPAGR